MGRDQAEALEKERTERLANHPGFGNELLSYHILTDSWSKTGEFPASLPVTTTAVMWGDDIILASGEIRPGVRSPEIWRGRYVE